MIIFNQEKIKIPEATRKNWQDIIDIMAELVGIGHGSQDPQPVFQTAEHADKTNDQISH